MVVRNRLLISISASLLLVLAQLMVLDHVHEHHELSSNCAYCLSADSTSVNVAATRNDIPAPSTSFTPPQTLRSPSIAPRSAYASRAPPRFSS